jgi:hypothetical protein
MLMISNFSFFTENGTLFLWKPLQAGIGFAALKLASPNMELK